MDADSEHEDGRNSVEDRAEDEEPASPDASEERGAGQRPGGAGAETDERSEGDRVEQRCLVDGVGHQGTVGGHFDGADDAGGGGEEDELPNGDDVGEGKCGEAEGKGDEDEAGDDYDVGTVEAVGEGAAEGQQKEQRDRFGHRHDPQPGAGMGQLPSQPADADALHPKAGEREDGTHHVDPIISDPQCRKNVGKAEEAKHDSDTLHQAYALGLR